MPDVVLCLDHDKAGMAASKKITAELQRKGLNIRMEMSINKDWNEDLKDMFGRSVVPAEDITII